MKRSACAITIALSVCACSRRVGTVHPPAPASAVHTAIERHVRNAVDAGEGDYELGSLRDRVAASQSDVDARLALAAAYGQRGYPDLELEHCRLAAARFPDSDRAALALAKVLHRMDRNAEAAESLAAFCRQHPAAPADLFSWVGILADNAGDIGGAEAWHRAAIERESGRDSFHNNLGYNLLLQARHETAAGEFRRALELNPRSEIARNNLGLALAANPGEAVLEWQSVSDPATAHSNMAAVLIGQKRYAEARQELGRALGFSPRHPAATRNLALLAELDGKGVAPVRPSAWRRASSILRRALGTPPAQQGHDAPVPSRRAAASN